MKFQNMKILVVFAAVLLVVQGCQLTPAQQAAINQADYGEYPTNYEDIVKQYFGRLLFDPYSAHYNISEPYQGYSSRAPIAGGGPDKFGYFVNVGVNAKNRLGGYVGEVQYRLLIRNGQVVQKWQLTWPSD